MTALEQVEQLTQQAITILLTERDAIDARLLQLGHNKTALPLKKRGRPAKISEPSSPLVIPVDTIHSNGSLPL
jgi:hypothetical protein